MSEISDLHEELIDELRSKIAQLTKERDELAAKCAEMREIIEARRPFEGGWARDRINHALSSQCGEGFLPPEKVKVLREAVNLVLDAYSFIPWTREPLSISMKRPENEQNVFRLVIALNNLKKHALSDQCGEGWMSPEKKKELENLHSHALLRIAKLVSREKVLVEALEKLAGYAVTVRLDRRKVVDDEIVCLQMEDWCNGLLERVEEAKQALEACKI